MSTHRSPETPIGNGQNRKRIVAALMGVATGLLPAACAPGSNGAPNTSDRGGSHLICSGLLAPVTVEAGDTFSGIVDKNVTFENVPPTQLPNIVAAIALHQNDINAGRAQPGQSFIIEGNFVNKTPPQPQAGSKISGLPEKCSRKPGGLG
ncbi:MAG: hypothetical protein WAU02_03865 [Candidatus Saccharimonadales bacterium]